MRAVREKLHRELCPSRHLYDLRPDHRLHHLRGAHDRLLHPGRHVLHLRANHRLLCPGLSHRLRHRMRHRNLLSLVDGP